LLFSSCGTYPPETHEAAWSDQQAEFVLKVTEGSSTASFVAEIVISNKTDSALSFPWPFVMPQCGDTNGNNIRIFDASGKELEMYGTHADFDSRPLIEIAGRSSESWRYELDSCFPSLAEPGRYAVQFWYFADESDQSTWIGRAEMERLTVVRRK
jgi:hypothetical protein